MIQGESYSLGVLFPDYNISNITKLQIAIGKTVVGTYPNGNTIIVNDCFRTELSGDTTKLLSGGNSNIQVYIVDALMGILKPFVTTLKVENTNITTAGTEVNSGYNFLLSVKIKESTVSYSYAFGNFIKGDPFTYDDFTPEQIEGLKVKGDAGTIEVGTVETGDAGTDVIIENVGTPSEAVLNFTIPKGDAGYTPYIGENGNWFINGVDTGVQAEGDATQQWVTDNFVVKETGKSLVDDTEIAKLSEYPELTGVATDGFINAAGELEQIAAAVGGFANNLYFAPTNSNVAGYKTLTYDLPSSETVVSQAVLQSDGDLLVASHLFSDAVAADIFPAGLWSFQFYGRVSSVAGAGSTNIGVRYFRYTSLGAKVYLFPTIVWSNAITNTVNNWIPIPVQQPSFVVEAGDRMGCDIYIKTSAATSRTVYYILGDGYASYLNNPNAVRHRILRAKNEELAYQHFDSITEKVTPIDADSVGLWDSVAVKFVRTTLTNFKAFFKTYFDTLYHAKLDYTPENAANKKTTLTDSDTDYPTGRAVIKGISANNEKFVGVEIDPTLSSSEPAPKSTIVGYRATELKRTGNLYYHKFGNSRIFNAFRPAIVNRATKKVDWYLNKNNPAERADGTISNPDWATQNICVVVPTLYRRIKVVDIPTGRYEVAYDIEPFDGAELFHVESAHSPGFASMDRTLNQLVSVVSSDARFRGGNNTAGNDLLPSTQLAKPATAISRINFENYAAAAGWETGNIADRSMWHELTAIYFANTNIQLDFTETLTADGYPQGGLGAGVSGWNSSRWNYRNGYYPIHNVGEGFMSLGCKTGVKNMVDEKYYVGAITSVSAGNLIATGNFAAGAGWSAGYIGKTVQNLQTLAEATITGKIDDNTLTLSDDIFTTAGHWFWIKDVTYSYQIPVFFGLEHLYGEIWDWVSGVNIEKSAEIVNGGTGESKAFVCTDFSKRATTITSDYKYIGLVPRSDGYIKELYRDFAIAKVNTGAGSATFMSDYGYYGGIPASGITIYGLLFGASALAGAYAGVRSSHANGVPTYAPTHFGARLRAKIEK